MSLWGCDCPLLALAACHRRGKVCRRLFLFSPLFRARAWRCLRLGLAFHVVDIPQSGLLAQIISLRQRSGYSGQILTLSDAARATPPCPAPACQWCVQASALLLRWGRYLRTHNLRVLIVYLFFLPVMLPSVLPRLGTDSAVRRFSGVWKPLFLRLPSPDRTPSLSLLSLFLSFIFFPTSFQRLGLLFWVPDILCRHSEVVLWNLLGV